MMARTRKRDDDSQYNNSINSDTTSLAALDASSMSATGSRSSLTFSSTKRTQRPRKRQRKSLTDALQSISLDKDKGVPDQILKMGDFPFSKACMAFTIASGNSTAVLGGGFGVHGSGSGSLFHDSSNSIKTALNSHQQLQRHIDRAVTSLNGDLYYDDDNSQLTSSSVEGEGGMEGDYDEEDEENDHEEDSHRKRLAQMTDMERAQRKAMLALVFGEDHREARKSASFSDREVSACESLTPPVRIDPVGSQSPPFASISTRTRSKAKSSAAAAVSSSAATTTIAISTTNHSSTKERDYKDPTDRKIEQLLRRSLKNLQNGSHPLQLPSTLDDDDGKMMSKWTPWKTQDDTMINHHVYSSRIGKMVTANANAAANMNPSQSNFDNPQNTTISMSIEGTNDLRNSAPTTNGRGNIGGMLQTRATNCGRRLRSNSLPSGMDKSMETTAMDLDG